MRPGITLSECHSPAAERSCSLIDDLQARVPFDHLELVGPQGADADLLDLIQCRTESVPMQHHRVDE